MALPYEVIADSSDRIEWLKLRKNSLGASESAAVLGLNPWSSPLRVYAEKIGAVEPDLEDNEAMWLGRELEPVIARLACEDIPEAREFCMDGLMYRSKQYPWLTATIDARLCVNPEWHGDPETPLEIKASSRTSDWAEGAPPHVYAQVQQQLLVLSEGEGYVAALLGSTALRWQKVVADQKFQRVLIESTAEFWNERVKKMMPPPADGMQATKEALALLYPDETGESIVGDATMIELDMMRQEAKQRISSAQAELSLTENRIKAFIADASECVLPNGVTYTLHKQERKAYEVKATAFRSLRRKGVK